MTGGRGGSPGTSHPSDASAESPSSVFLPEELPEEFRARQQVDEQLSLRPRFSIRARIILAFSLIFALCGAITVWSIWTMYILEYRLAYLEASGDYLREIQQARRFEKNYFLYGTNLDDALEHIGNADRIIVEKEEAIEKILGGQNYSLKLQQLRQYESLLKELKGPIEEARKNVIEGRLRQYGAEIVAFAGELEAHERENVDRMLRLSRYVPFFFLGVLLIMMIFGGTFFARNLLHTLGRFMKYTERIGRGDFSPIMPARKYQDEFSQLAKAFNQMVRELDRRERILVESHKLRAIGTLVAGVAHELNNPLNNTMLTSALLEEDFSTLNEEEKKEMIRDIIRETERAQKIVRNLLDFARESKTHVQPLKLEVIVNDSVRLVANQLRMGKVRLETHLRPDLPMVHGDEQMLKQVFVNLLINALDVVPPQGKISVAVGPAPEEGFLSVEVSDNGPGIPEHLLQRIFDPFFTTKTRGRGTGLGLSVSQSIVRRLGGNIKVVSRVGAGTTFTVLLPTTEVPFSMPDTQHPASPA